ncbi:MAG TPA: hypothetical protein VD971_11935 [Phycisphaerales bacterium]|nr:hypothetical protein [Phycisphaerales bacterium]
MDLYVDTREKTFSVVAPGDLGSRTVIEQTIPETLPLRAVMGMLGAMAATAGQADMVFKITISA